VHLFNRFNQVMTRSRPWSPSNLHADGHQYRWCGNCGCGHHRRRWLRRDLWSRWSSGWLANGGWSQTSVGQRWWGCRTNPWANNGLGDDAFSAFRWAVWAQTFINLIW